MRKGGHHLQADAGQDFTALYPQCLHLFPGHAPMWARSCAVRGRACWRKGERWSQAVGLGLTGLYLSTVFMHALSSDHTPTIQLFPNHIPTVASKAHCTRGARGQERRCRQNGLISTGPSHAKSQGRQGGSAMGEQRSGVAE